MSGRVMGSPGKGWETSSWCESPPRGPVLLSAGPHRGLQICCHILCSLAPAFPFPLAWWLGGMSRPLLPAGLWGVCPRGGLWQPREGFPGLVVVQLLCSAPSPGCWPCAGTKLAPPGGGRLAWLPKPARAPSLAALIGVGCPFGGLQPSYF